MVAFAFFGNTLFLTILVSMLSNTFGNISTNATAEIQFRRAVFTLEGVKADAVFAYQPPFNLLAVFIFLPLKFVVSPRWFHKIPVATVRLVNLPLLLIIAVAERRLLWGPGPGSFGVVGEPAPARAARRRLWRRWQLSAHRYLRAVFQVPPPDDVHDDIAVDDDLTHHLIRRQFMMRAPQPAGAGAPRKPSRRDSMFPGLASKLRGSFAEGGDEDDGVAARVAGVERSVHRIEAMLRRLVPRVEGAVEAADEAADEPGEGSSLKEGDGFTTESSFRGQG